MKVVREIEDIEKDSKGRPIVNQYFQLVNDEHVYVIGDCASSDLPPSAQLAEEQAERAVKALKLRYRNEPLPEKMPEIKMKGSLGSLGKKQGFAFVLDMAVTGRIAD